MSWKNIDKIRIIIMIIIIFILSFIFGSLLGEQIKLNKASEKLEELNVKKNEIDEEYQKIHNHIENLINEDI